MADGIPNTMTPPDAGCLNVLELKLTIAESPANSFVARCPRDFKHIVMMLQKMTIDTVSTHSGFGVFLTLGSTGSWGAHEQVRRSFGCILAPERQDYPLHLRTRTFQSTCPKGIVHNTWKATSSQAKDTNRLKTDDTAPIPCDHSPA